MPTPPITTKLKQAILDAFHLSVALTGILTIVLLVKLFSIAQSQDSLRAQPTNHHQGTDR